MGPLIPGVPAQVPLWMAVNLKQGQKCRIIPPEWMGIGEFYTECNCFIIYLDTNIVLEFQYLSSTSTCRQVHVNIR